MTRQGSTKSNQYEAAFADLERGLFPVRLKVYPGVCICDLRMAKAIRDEVVKKVARDWFTTLIRDSLKEKLTPEAFEEMYGEEDEDD